MDGDGARAVTRGAVRGAAARHPRRALPPPASLQPAHARGRRSRPTRSARWVRNRYYYQTRIPIKDGIILAKCEDPAFRRGWIRRIHDHDGDGAREGGLELWLRLAEAAGLDRARGRVAARRAARRAPRLRRLRAVRGRPRPARGGGGVADRARGGRPHGERIDGFEQHYPWVKTDGLALLPQPHASRRRATPRRGSAYVLEHARRRGGPGALRGARSCASARSSGRCSTASSGARARLRLAPARAAARRGRRAAGRARPSAR